MTVPHQAKSSGKFSNEELLSLKKEFQHHKDKIHEYNILMDTISRTEGESLLCSCNFNVFGGFFSEAEYMSTLGPAPLHYILPCSVSGHLAE